MAELQQVGAMDKAAQDKLMEDLRQTDPALWPLVVQQFRAAAAYRRRAEERDLAARQGGAGPDSAMPAAHLSGDPRAERWGPNSSPMSSGPPAVGRNLLPGSGPPPAVGRLPAADDAAVAPGRAPQGDFPRTLQPSADVRTTQRPAQQPEARGGRVVPASYDAVTGANEWQAHLSAATQALEAQVGPAPKTDEEMAQAMRLRMLYLLAGRRDAAVQPIPAAPPALQEFWSRELCGLAAWLDTQRTPDATRRAGEAKQVLDEAVSRLGETAPLIVRNLAFCSEVQSYGCLKPFAKYEFAPEQEVLLYAEIENFASEPTPKGFHTALRSSYQIFDSRGQRVADHDFTVTEEYCQNPRRDFFIGYHLRLPKRIYPGKHTLQLTVEDLKSKKVGQSSIDLTVKETKE